MRIRKLQRRNGNNAWFVDCYVGEVEDRQVVFRYNRSAWGGIGSFYNDKIQSGSARLEDMEAVIPASPIFRWLPIESLTEGQIKALNVACGISDQWPDDDHRGEHLAPPKRASKAVVVRPLVGGDTAVVRPAISQAAARAGRYSPLATKPLPPLPLNRPSAPPSQRVTCTAFS